jgi:hypothetical protein
MPFFLLGIFPLTEELLMFHNWRQRQNLTRKRAASQQEQAWRRAKEQRRLTLETLEDRRLMMITPASIIRPSLIKKWLAPLGFSGCCVVVYRTGEDILS